MINGYISVLYSIFKIIYFIIYIKNGIFNLNININLYLNKSNNNNIYLILLILKKITLLLKNLLL